MVDSSKIIINNHYENHNHNQTSQSKTTIKSHNNKITFKNHNQKSNQKSQPKATIKNHNQNKKSQK